MWFNRLTINLGGTHRDLIFHHIWGIYGENLGNPWQLSNSTWPGVARASRSQTRARFPSRGGLGYTRNGRISQIFECCKRIPTYFPHIFQISDKHFARCFSLQSVDAKSSMLCSKEVQDKQKESQRLTCTVGIMVISMLHQFLDENPLVPVDIH